MSNILIIENDKKSASRAAGELKKNIQDAKIQICLTGHDGLKYLKRKSIDLVISESHLSDINGFDLIGGMAELGGNWPTIIISTPGRGDEAVRYMRSGIYDYIVKDNEYLSSLPKAAQRALDLSYIFDEKRNIVETSIEREWRREISKITQVFNHEINDPLMTIVGNIQLLLSKKEIDTEGLREKLEAIEDAARRIARVTTFFADYNIEAPLDPMKQKNKQNAVSF